jgi:RNA polymerase sigma-70 factor (ECF subfamily)
MDDILIKRARDGDKDSFTRIILGVKDQAYRVAFSYLHNEADSLDAVCNAVEKAYINIKKLKKTEYFNTWLIKIVINECKQLQRRNRGLMLVEAPEIADIEGNTDSVETMDLEQSLLELGAAERTLVHMKFYEGYTLEEIAEIMQIPIGTVKTKIYGSLRILRSKLECREV